MARANRSWARGTAPPWNGRQVPRAAALRIARCRATLSVNLCAVGWRNARKQAFPGPCAACRVDPGGLLAGCFRLGILNEPLYLPQRHGLRLSTAHAPFGRILVIPPLL